MRRIDTANSLFTDGDPSQGIEATPVWDWWLNATQEEIAQAIEGFGGVLDANNNHQLKDALLAALALKADISSLQPGFAVGDTKISFTETVDTGWLEANGAAISRTTYAALFAKYGTMYGAGDGATTFNLPDPRGKFLRVWDHGKGVDPDAAARTNRGDGTTGDHVGTKQADDFKSHTHTTNAGGLNQISAGAGGVNAIWYGAGTPTSATGGSETRPANINIMLLVKY